MRSKMLITVAMLGFVGTLLAQQTQTIRGEVTDKQSGMPLPFVSVVVTSQNTLGVETDENGRFEINEVPVGRLDLLFSSVQMQPVVLKNIELISSKELVLNIEMEDDLTVLQEIKIESKNTAKNRPAINKQALVSAKQVSIEQVNRYAGSFSDVARMAMNFAGSQQTDDSKNDIVVRGNSSNGLLWRLNDIDIPNPNHFGSGGATGGPVNMINTNMLSNSDFFMSAFVPEYNNAISGVFDLKYRKGNLYQSEFIGQVAFNGFELLAEGPIKKETSSYIASYRYSVLGVMSALGLNFGTGTAIPEYQDVGFNIYTAVGKKGQLTFFGIGGTSNIKFEKPNSSDDNVYTDRETTSNSKRGVIALQYRHQISDRAYSLSTLAFSGSNAIDDVKEDKQSFIDYNKNHNANNNPTGKDFYKSDYTTKNIELIHSVQIKLSKQNSLKMGVRGKQQTLNYQEHTSLRVENNNQRYQEVANIEKTFRRMQGFISFHRKFNNKLSTTLGASSQYFDGNNKFTLDPRLSISYKINPKNTLSIGYGLHTLQPDLLHFSYQKEDGTYYNTELDYTRANHFVVGYATNLMNNWLFKMEAYYQYIFNAPRATLDSSKPYTEIYSALNSDSATSRSSSLRTPFQLEDGAKGINYGLEFTLEKPLDKGFYFLSTLSLFNSKYKARGNNAWRDLLDVSTLSASDDSWRNTAFNGNYVFNLLVGKEWYMGAGVLSVDIRATYAGGMRSIPIDLDESRKQQRPIYKFNEAYQEQNNAYFRPDLRIGFKLNGKRVSQEWAVDIQNVINKKDNIFSKSYDEEKREIVIKNQRYIFPVGIYRIYF